MTAKTASWAAASYRKDKKAGAKLCANAAAYEQAGAAEDYEKTQQADPAAKIYKNGGHYGHL